MDDEARPESLQESVLESLLQLHLDFAALGVLEEAGPLLHKLMELAYYRKIRSGAGSCPRQRALKPELH